MAFATTAEAITAARLTLGDSATGKLQRFENLTKPDGTNTIFTLANFNIVAGSVYVTKDSSIRQTTGFTLDAANGILTFTSPPSASLVKFYADYNYQVATDTEYTEFIADALSLFGMTAVTQLPDGLRAAFLTAVKHFYFSKRATDYATRYNSSGGTAGHSVESVCKNFTMLAEKAWDSATQARDDYYKRQGRKAAPASGSFGYGIDPYTPNR